MAYDINKILAEYGDDDFGFSAVSEEDYNAVINEKADTVDEYSARLKEVEKLVLPFLRIPISSDIKSLIIIKVA